MLDGSNIVVLDLECLLSPEWCKQCLQPQQLHGPLYGENRLCPEASIPLALSQKDAVYTYEAIGWMNKPALNITVGCFFDYQTMELRWFDRASLRETVEELWQRNPLLVSFNGTVFDFVIMRGLLRREAEGTSIPDTDLSAMCDDWKVMCASSFDLCQHVQTWRPAPPKDGTSYRSLDALAAANGLGSKADDGALMPLYWREGYYGKVIAHVADDVYKTQKLFEQTVRGEPILRRDGARMGILAPAIAVGAYLAEQERKTCP